MLVRIDQSDPVPFLYHCVWHQWEKSYAVGTKLMLCHRGPHFLCWGSTLGTFLPQTVLQPCCGLCDNSTSNHVVWAHSLLATAHLYSGSKRLATPSCVLPGLFPSHCCISAPFLKCAWKPPPRGVRVCKSTGCALLVLLSKACVIGVCSSLEEAIRTKAATHGTLPFLLLFFEPEGVFFCRTHYILQCCWKHNESVQ